MRRDINAKNPIMKKHCFFWLVCCAPAALQAQQVIVETFANNSQQEVEVSGGTWNGGARPGLIGGDGRHGSFDPTLGVAIGGNVYAWSFRHGC